MRSLKYLAVVPFVPIVSLPSTLDRYTSTSAPATIHTGTAISLESLCSHPVEASARTRVLVCSSICLSDLVAHEGEESRIDLPVDRSVWSGLCGLRCDGLRCDDCITVNRFTEGE